MSALITITTAPRDYDGMLAVSKAQQYRLALSIGHVKPNTPEAKAFADLPKEQRTTEILNAVLAHDTNGSVAPADPTPTADAPQTAAPQTAPQPQQPAPPAPPTSAAPAVPGALAAPTPSRQPATSTDPGNAGGTPTNVAAGALLEAVTTTRQAADELVARAKKLQTVTSNTNKELKELQSMMAGFGKAIHILLVLNVNMAEQVLGIPKEALAGMLEGEIKGDVSQLLPGLETPPGKQ